MKLNVRIAFTAFLVIVILICVYFIAGLLKSSSAEGNYNKQPDHRRETEKPMEISIGMWGIQDCFDGDEVLTTIEDKFNVKFIPVDVNYTNWTQEYLKMAAADSLPDIIVHDIIGSSTYSAWVEQNKISAIPTNLSEYPKLQDYMNLDYNQNFQDDSGNFYFIPRLTYSDEKLWALDRCIVMRKDWLNKLNLSMPQNSEEFNTVLKAFTQSDFDGNGKQDTIGLATENLNTLEAIYLSVFPELSNVERGWMQEDNQWIPVYASKKAGAALNYAKELYSLGLLDKNFPYRTINEAFSLFTDGKCGAISCQYFSLIKYWNKIKNNKDYMDKIIVMTPWKTSDGNQYRFTSSLHWSESYFSAKVSDEKMKKIMQIYDFLLSDEASKLFYHQDDPSWTERNRSIDIFSYLVSWNQDTLYQYTPSSLDTYGADAIKYANQMIDWYSKNTERVNYNYDITFCSTPSKLRLPTYSTIQADMVQTIIGEEDAVAAWDKILAKYRAESPMDKAINEVTERANRQRIK
ncbi:type 2 periplasmic-binding domain-containing protein [Anaerocolumna xylanovorans]|uniref:Putative aldouronate transport system substrate-binding protein n=1 Tax=Anaerocolumna xylanovorans DSM 12503 TaxID=1121345 RepID=A0A1M7XXR8_9FIRM|nr:hypothetical protein [Anaerocolumna xylanovorans]SHO43773.1 putative aldouronate transport system substrate-binding protein [Anaerocolumna xylanovorans DSM 12503]